MIAGFARWLDERVGGSGVVLRAMDKIFPDHWAFYLGEFALYSFLMLVATGVWLALAFVPSQAMVIYHGPYLPLVGTPVAEAFASVLAISLTSPVGLFFRQLHHWAAVVFLAAIILHLARIFFTGAFRKPREINWIVGFTLLVLAAVTGFTGYSLPYDALSGTGLRIAISVVNAAPLIGPWLANAVSGGPFGAPQLIPHLYVLHVYFLPVTIGLLIAIHLAILIRQKHTQFRSAPARDNNVVGRRLWPDYALRSLSVGATLAAVLAGLATFITINPVWHYGSYRPWEAPAPAEPDWYAGFLDGALRLGPAATLHLGPFALASIFWPGILMPGIVLGVLYAWPWIDAAFTRDRAAHSILQTPLDAPWRTGFGVAMLTAALILTLAASDDVQAAAFRMSLTGLTIFYRWFLLIGSLGAGFGAVAIVYVLRARATTPAPERIVDLLRTESGGFREREPST